MFCDQCGSEVPPDARFCEGCGTAQETDLALQSAIPQSQASPSFGSGAEMSLDDQLRMPRLEPSRIGASILLLLSVIGIWYSSKPESWTLLLLPLLVGLLYPLIRAELLTSQTEDWELRFAGRFDKAKTKSTRFSQYFSRPLWGGSMLLWKATRSISDPHLRAGLRVTTFLYFIGLMVGLLLFVGYTIVVVVVTIILIILTLLLMSWLMKGILSNDWSISSGGGTNLYGLGKRIVHSRPTADFWGDPKTDHYDERGQKGGESRPGKDFWGDPKADHYDESDRKVGESRPGKDFWGDPKTDHYDESDRKVGESRPGKDFWGDPKTDHYDESGRKIGESRPGKDFWGDPKIDHHGKDD